MLPKKISRTIYVNDTEWRYAVFSNEIIMSAKDTNIKLKYDNSHPVLPSHMRKAIDLHNENKLDSYTFEDIVKECIKECKHEYRYTRLNYIYKDKIPNYPKERLSPFVSRRCTKCQIENEYVIEDFVFISDYEKDICKKYERIADSEDIEVIDWNAR